MVLVGLILTLITLSGVKQLKKKKLSKLVYRSESAKIADKELKEDFKNLD